MEKYFYWIKFYDSKGIEHTLEEKRKFLSVITFKNGEYKYPATITEAVVDLNKRKKLSSLLDELSDKDFSYLNYYYEYKIIKPIKSGGFAEVYLAENILNKKLVAIKKTDIKYLCCLFKMLET